MDDLNIIKKRKNKVINWLKNPSNLLLVSILAVAILIRIYYFSLTSGQAVWWDSAEYMNMARAWAFNLDYEFLPVRPVLFSLITSIFLRISNTEFLPRLFIFALSIASIIGAYLLGKVMYSKKVGLLCAFFTSIFYLHIFHTYRLLVDLPSFTFFTFAAFFFYKYFKTNKNKMLYLGAIIAALGILFRITTATILFALLIYILITEKLKFLKKKEYWIAALIFLLILSPYIIWGYFQFDGFVITQAGAWNAPPEGTYFSNGFTNIKSYLSLFPGFFSWTFLIFFIGGLLLMYKLILGLDILLRKNNSKLKRDLYLLLIFLIPILTVSFSVGFIEERYIFNAFPAVFVISSAFIIKSYHFIKKKNKVIAIILLILLLLTLTYYQINQADSLIKNKKDSYMPVKQAGLWIKENSKEGDIILTLSRPQIKYYSERDVLRITPKKEDLKPLISSNSNIKFYMISVFENHDEWMYTFPQENNFTIINAYFVDQTKQQPILIIYEL
tara:strand:+ start:6923 stop:8422 length:1500 start_codon:yes stop_codon:yes gene_type:complete